MGLGGRNKVSADFSMSSMTDLVFLLLIFFIMVSTMATPYAVQVDLPEGDVTSIYDKSRVDIQILSDTTYFLNGKPIVYGDMEETIRLEFAKFPDDSKQTILLSVDKTVPTGIMNRVVILARRNGWGLGLKTNGKPI